MSRFTWSHDLGRALLAPLPPSAGLIVISDLDTFPLWYMQHVEHYRKDVRIVNRILLKHRWYRESMSDPLGSASASIEPAQALSTLIKNDPRPWFSSPEPLTVKPFAYTAVPYHLTVHLAKEPVKPMRPRGFPWRGVHERIRHLPEPHARLTVGYTVECLRNLETLHR